MHCDLTLNDFPEIKKTFNDLNKETNYMFVARCIQTGDLLNKLKSYVPVGQWCSFQKQNFKMSDRTCQGYMKLSNSNIDKRYWHLGMDKLHSILERKEDLSIFNLELLNEPRRTNTG